MIAAFFGQKLIRNLEFYIIKINTSFPVKNYYKNACDVSNIGYIFYTFIHSVYL